MLEWKISPFQSLQINELYEILRLRSEVFVVEQRSIYLDIDDKDQIAQHIRGYKDGKLVAYARIFRSGDYFEDAAIGRIVVAPSVRGERYGHQLLDISLNQLENIWEEKAITISAQVYLKKFYEFYGFSATSEEYDEDGIPHIMMRKENELTKTTDYTYG